MLAAGSYARQYGIVLTANLNIICAGISMSWASPVLVKLSDSENIVLNRPITDTEGALIVSTVFIGGLFSLLFLPSIIETIGRKFSILTIAIPRIICYIVLIFATEVWMVIFARFLMGASDGVVVSVVNIYSSEIANKQIRGSLGTLLHFCASLGILLILCYGPFLDFRTLNVVTLCVTIFTCLPSFFLPESPYYLYKKGKFEESKHILIQLRGTKSLADEELNEYEINLNKTETITTSLREIMKTKRYIKSIVIVIFLNVMSHLTGYTIITNYLQSLLIASQSNFSPELSSVLVGLLQLIACFGTIIIIDRFGRKPILLFGQIGVAIGFIALGVFFIIVADEVVGFMNFLPLISMVVIVFSYNLGIGCTIFPLMTELLDGKIRVLGVTLGSICGLITIVLLVTFFPPLVVAIGETAIFWTFGITSVVLCVFIAFVIPETNGMSYKDIQKGLDEENEIKI